MKTMDHGMVALSPCRVAIADHAKLKRLTETEAHLTRLLWLDTLVDGAIHRGMDCLDGSTKQACPSCVSLLRVVHPPQGRTADRRYELPPAADPSRTCRCAGAFHSAHEPGDAELAPLRGGGLGPSHGPHPRLE
ncbi:hypothetical protein MPL3365_230010 [Mesorhizobium plurifarium]|uniref:Uncharacterized protein n=1 Tax=Mesorhizobium plurifarium TaxID=69974 RepID=A0A090GAN7_MESPL|nr:hypothetical protein MPL3365_230010 [Mesorhizobium plurifarium]